eukprot:CAMPEP_0197892698 /NCGR_PEP_ID=MMETSP1439-20131203/31276_1 /TAXON_ID=66791 /ORGANISM="Gonyaulax spinifera, Strain CCMP409" /LENGTH=61 /DNA_ID=CAMNT_0043512893 /DNA_START=1 /DNA_END=186 /DNA_ORIENTATION=+
MSVNVLERLFVRALPAAGLARHGSLVDRWETGAPPACLTTAGSRKRTAPFVAEGTKKRARA